MNHRDNLLAIAALLAIPVAVLSGGALFGLIDPEWAHHTGDYVRNYRLIEILRQAILLIALLAALCFWFLCIWLVVRARERTPRWLLLAVLGPLGLVVLILLDVRSRNPEDRYGTVRAGLRWPSRLLFDTACFFLLLALAGTTVVAMNQLTLLIEATRRGVDPSVVAAERDASSGMWAFSEMIETMFVFTLLWLLLPLVFNLIARWWKCASRPG